MKKLGFMLLLAMAMVFASCKDESSTDMLSMIPADVDYVGSVNVGSIIEKAGIKVENGQVTFPDSYSAVVEKGMGSNDMQMLGQLAQSGFDFDGKVYMFGDKSAKGVFIVPVKDAGATKTFLESSTGKTLVADGDMFKIERPMGRGSAAYLTGNSLVVVANYMGDDVDSYLKGVIAGGGETSIKDNADAMAILNHEGDMAMYGDYKNILAMGGAKVITEMYGAEYAGFLDAYRGIGYTLDFGKKEVELYCKMFYDENNEIIKQSLKAVGKPSAEGLKFIPADMQLVFSGSINGEEMVKNELLGSLLDKVFTPQVSRIITKDEAMEYLGSIDGPLTLGWNYVDYITSREREVQVYGAIKTDKADDLCKKIQSTVTAEGQGFIACSKVGSEYVVNLLGSQVFAFGSKDGFFHFRSMPQQVKESMYDNDIARGIFEKTPSGLYANLLKDSRANNMIVSIMPRMQFSAYAKVEMDDMSSGTLKLVIEEPEGNNSLETILAVIAGAMN